MSGMTKIKGNIVTSDTVINGGEVCFENGKITYCGKERSDDGYDVVECSGKYVSAGFIDIHVHGGGGYDFSDATREAFLGVSRFHASHGTATMLPTTLSCPDDELFRLIDVYESVRDEKHDGAFMAGLHIEGPYCALEFKGAQDEKYIRTPSAEHYLGIMEKCKHILRWTVAPELDGADGFITAAVEHGIAVSIGHSDAYYEDALRAYERGCRLMTHFYSGMSSMRRIGGFRYPGLIEAGYMIDDMCVELIADGCHLPVSILNYIYRVKGADRTVLCTDSMRAAGQTSGVAKLGSLDNGYEVFIEDGVAKMPDRTAFAGSIATTDRLVRNMYKKAGATLADSVKMITATPARLVGLATKGSLSAGYDADFTVFDDDINVSAVYSGGRRIYEKKEG